MMGDGVDDGAVAKGSNLIHYPECNYCTVRIPTVKIIEPTYIYQVSADTRRNTRLRQHSCARALP